MVKEIGDIYSGEGVLQRHVELMVRNSTGLSRIEDPGDHPHFVRGDWVMKPTIDAINRNRMQGKRPVVAKSVLKSVGEIDQYGQSDWMARLQTKQLGKHVLRGAQEGQVSDIHGANPIPGLAYGAEFGLKKDRDA